MSRRKNSFIAKFLQLESAGGILLVGAALLAIVLANSPFAYLYGLLIDTTVAIQVGAMQLSKPLLLWVNDGFMAIFFFLIGLELKREFLEGELSDKKKIILPGLGAVGGMLVPAAVYLALNADNPAALNGWAIPTATDIAFALGILTLLGSRVPPSLKVFLTSLAIFDDVGAILIIAFFYTSNISLSALAFAFICVVVLFLLNRFGHLEKGFYVAVGFIMWISLLKSGVHATLTGVILAIFIPMRNPEDPRDSPLRSMEHDLHPMVTYLILPTFAFCNAGISLEGMGLEQILHDVTLGIALGLFLGKQFGVFAFCWLGIKLGLTVLPKEISWLSLYGVATLCGIGFTMSLFIGSLAFEESGINQIFDERLGIILGSLASGIVGYMILRSGLSGHRKQLDSN